MYGIMKSAVWLFYTFLNKTLKKCTNSRDKLQISNVLGMTFDQGFQLMTLRKLNLLGAKSNLITWASDIIEYPVYSLTLTTYLSMSKILGYKEFKGIITNYLYWHNTFKKVAKY